MDTFWNRKVFHKRIIGTIVWCRLYLPVISQFMMIYPENLSQDEKVLITSLIENGQEHLFSGCHTPEDVSLVVSQLVEANKVLAPGGLKDYIVRGRRLLAESKIGLNPFDNCKVSIPSGVVLDPESSEYSRLETLGEDELSGLCFVLVAGGLGERLGFPGIKISLPVETQTGITYMQLFAEYILEFQRMARIKSGRPDLILPLAIMTSEDTHSKTEELLNTHNFFGLTGNAQVTLMMQGKVPCFQDSDARIAVSGSHIEMKPHGHGDVHGLLLQTGLAQKWKSEGRKWLFFFQDTNSVSMRALTACLAVSRERNFAMNSFSVPRAPGEASGGICRLEYPDGRDVTISIEYNVLGSLLAPQGGDVAGPDGNSPYPGNCNILLFDLNAYVPALERSKGVVPEFVNPKYTDATKTVFKSPSRLECLMQDFALLLEGHPIGFCSMPKWLTFSVVKNSIAEAVNKQRLGQPLDCAFSGECEFYDSNCRILKLATKQARFKLSGCSEKSPVEFAGVKCLLGPRVTLLPSFGVTINCVAEKIVGNISIVNGQKSSLVLGGHETKIGDITVDGAFVATDGQCFRHREIVNKGWAMNQVNPLEKNPVTLIRGFSVDSEQVDDVPSSRAVVGI